jgi:hypothetical protein
MLKHVSKKSSIMSLEFAAQSRLRREARLTMRRISDKDRYVQRVAYLVLTNLIKRGRELIVGERFQMSFSFRVLDVPCLSRMMSATNIREYQEQLHTFLTKGYTQAKVIHFHSGV